MKISDHFNNLVKVVVIYLRPKLFRVKSEERPKVDKAEVIISMAQKRFGLYGIEKTSMREIASDLKMSKASLYYYFPDKESLYRRVISREQNEFLKILQEDISSISDPVQCLMKYSLTRLSHFRRLINLSRLRLASYNELKPVIVDSLRNFKEEEIKIVMKILEKGRTEKLFEIEDPYNTATLFLDLLKGLRSAFLTGKNLLVINETEYRTLSEKVKEIVEIFIKGLMYK